MRKQIKNKLFLLFGLVAFLAAGCGSGNSNKTQPITIKVWGTFETAENMSFITDAFQAKYPGVTVQYTQKNVDTYENDLLNALAAGTGPDVYVIHNDWLPKYKDKLIEAPAKYFTVLDYKTNFVDVANADFVDGGKVYAAPISVDSLALYYNKDILGSAGIATPAVTWDDLRNQSKRITQRYAGSFNRSAVALGTSANINRATDIVSLLMLQDRTVPYSSDHSRVTLDQAVRQNDGSTFYPAADALNFYTSFANQSSDVYSWNSRQDYSTDAFANGDVGYVYGYSYLRDTLKQKAPNLNYDIAPVPQPSTGQNLVNFANYWGFAVSKQSKNPNAGWALISFMTQKDTLLSYYKHHNLPSGRKDIIAEQVSDPDIGVFASENLTAKSMYKKDPVKFEDIFSQMIDNISLRGQRVEEALSAAVRQIDVANSQFQ